MRRPVSEDGAPESDVFPGALSPRLAPRVIGHEAAQAAMLDAYRGGRLAHAWLLSGPEGIGKATLAYAFARFLLAHPDPTSPEVLRARDLSVPDDHAVARQLAALSHPDFAVVRRGWNAKSRTFYSEIRVEDVRAGQSVFRLAASGGWRVLLIDAADDLNRNGVNALLKTIEEPPERALALIVAHRPGRLPPTIRSRCRRLTLEPLAPEAISAIVRAGGPPWSDLPEGAVAAAAARADGSAREALRRLDPDASDAGAQIETLVAKLPNVDWRAALRLADRFAGAAGAPAHALFVLALYDWVAARTRAAPAPAQLEALTQLWDRLRRAARDVEALNIDRKAHALAALQEIAERAGRL